MVSKIIWYIILLILGELPIDANKPISNYKYLSLISVGIQYCQYQRGQ